MVEMNLNTQIKIKLTDKGKSVIIEDYQKSTKYSYAEIKNYIDSKIDADGFFTTELWNFSNVFGKYLFNGAMEEVIEGNNIYFDEKKIIKTQKAMDDISTIVK